MTNSGVAEVLRGKRIEKGVTVEKVREETRIPVKFVIALEEGNFKIFPARVYLRGFFLMYCKYLDIDDAMQLWDALQKEFPVESKRLDTEGNGKQSKPQILTNHQSTLGVASNLAGDTFSRFWGHFVLWVTEGQNWITAFVVLPLLILGIVIGLSSYVRYRRYKESPEKSLDVSRMLGQTTTARATLPSVLTSVSEKKSGERQSWTVELLAKDEPTWVNIDLDGKRSFQGILSSSQKRTFNFKEFAKLKVGNPKGLTLLVNGKEMAFAAEDLERGGPIEVELNSQTLKN